MKIGLMTCQVCRGWEELNTKGAEVNMVAPDVSEHIGLVPPLIFTLGTGPDLVPKDISTRYCHRFHTFVQD